MKRIWRWMFNGIVALSLALFVAATGFSIWQISTSKHQLTFQKSGHSHVVVVLPPPYVFPVNFAILPSGWYVNRKIRQWQAKRRLVGVCIVCGYDLRATPHRCPECGTVPKNLV